MEPIPVAEDEVVVPTSATGWGWLGGRLAEPAPLADETLARLAPSGFARYVRVDHFSGAEPELAPYADDRLSLEGWLPDPILRRLLGALGPAGAGPVQAAVWDGFGGLPPWLLAAPRWCAERLCFHCVELDASRVSSFDLGGFTHSASLWWRPDRRLCAVSPLDLPVTIVATDDGDLAARLVAADGLAATALDPG